MKTYTILQNGIEIWTGKAHDEYSALAKVGIEVFEEPKEVIEI